MKKATIKNFYKLAHFLDKIAAGDYYLVIYNQILDMADKQEDPYKLKDQISIEDLIHIFNSCEKFKDEFNLKTYAKALKTLFKTKDNLKKIFNISDKKLLDKINF